MVLFLCTRKEVFDEFQFDEERLKGFHGYDVDYSLQVFTKYKVKVVFDILMTHYSSGNVNKAWVESAIVIAKKWKHRLPVSVYPWTKKEQDFYHWQSMQVFLQNLFFASVSLLRNCTVLFQLLFFRQLLAPALFISGEIHGKLYAAQKPDRRKRRQITFPQLTPDIQDRSMINVTKPFLPPIEEYKAYIDQIWERNWLTNNGPLVNELELRLKELLNIDHFLFTGNGTIALQIAIKALELHGDIITTPFSYVATTSSVVWEGCNPVFVDIDANTLNIDAAKIDSAITDNTTAIMATHTYGNPCDIDAIQAIAGRHNLKVIYDAAHCFGTKYKGKSVYLYGDISTASFHATKVFHTIEGGALITKDSSLLRKMAYMRNFGHNGPLDFADVGINGKKFRVSCCHGFGKLKIHSGKCRKPEEAARQVQRMDEVLSLAHNNTNTCGRNQLLLFSCHF